MSEHPEEEPLDPAVEAIRVKMVRLLAVSGGIMMLGLMAVLFGIVYKINQPSPSAPAQSSGSETRTIKIPAGARIVSTQTSGDKIVLTVQATDGQTILYVYRLDGTLISTFSVREE